jgi:hypothetical protein
MEIVYAGFPLVSVVISRVSTRMGSPGSTFDQKLKVTYTLPIWIFIALTLGLTGYDVAQLNNSVVTGAFLILCWLLGNGYALVNTFQHKTINFLYAFSLLGTSLFLYERLHHFGKTQGQIGLAPALGWSAFITATTVLQL